MINTIPKVCICVMLYNQEAWVAEAIQSVFDQDYPHLTIVISDDASTDNTGCIAEEMVRNYKGVHEVVLNKNIKNMGRVQHFLFLHDSPRFYEAEYYFHVDGDDVMMTDRVSRCMEVFIKEDVSFLACNAEIIDGKGKVKTLFRPPQGIYDLSIETFIQNSWNPTCFGAGMAWKKDIFDIFGNFRAGPRNGDQVMPFRGHLLGGSAYISNALIQWRHHGNNTTLGLQRDVASDDKTKNIIEERMQCNLVANYVAMYQDLLYLIEKNPQYPRKDLLHMLEQRIFQETHRWVLLRHSMAQSGVGLE